jgi:hypothetical protein
MIMTAREISVTTQIHSLKILSTSGANIMDPGNLTYLHMLKQLGRPPVLADFSHWHQNEYACFVASAKLLMILMDESIDLHIRFNNGARKGSIAKMVTRPSMGKYGIQPQTLIEVEWDNGKKWSFDFTRAVYHSGNDRHHELIVGYDGPTVYCFEKKPKVVEPTPVLLDNYGRQIELGHWVMDGQFKIGKVARISPKGTLWIDMLEQNSGKYKMKASQQQFGRSTTELLRIDLPEGFEVTATILDKDVTGLDIIPTFTYEAKHD